MVPPPGSRSHNNQNYSFLQMFVRIVIYVRGSCYCCEGGGGCVRMRTSALWHFVWTQHTTLHTLGGFLITIMWMFGGCILFPSQGPQILTLYADSCCLPRLHSRSAAVLPGACHHPDIVMQAGQVTRHSQHSQRLNTLNTLNTVDTLNTFNYRNTFYTQKPSRLSPAGHTRA